MSEEKPKSYWKDFDYKEYHVKSIHIIINNCKIIEFFFYSLANNYLSLKETYYNFF